MGCQHSHSSELYHAAQNGQLDVVRELIRQGHVPSTEDVNVAAENGHADVVLDLFLVGGPITLKTWEIAYRNCGADVSRILWDHIDFKPVRRYPRRPRDRGKVMKQNLYQHPAMENRMFDAASKGKCDSIERYIHMGINMDAQDAYGYSALMFAAQNGELEVCRILIRAGVRLDFQNDFGDTAISLARDKHPDVAELLESEQLIRERVKILTVFRHVQANQLVVPKSYQLLLKLPEHLFRFVILLI